MKNKKHLKHIVRLCRHAYYSTVNV